MPKYQMPHSVIFFAAAALLFAANSAVAGVIIDGGADKGNKEYNNEKAVTSATVSGSSDSLYGTLNNTYKGTIGTVTVNGTGYLKNDGGKIGTAVINDKGKIQNMTAGTITSVTVNGNGQLRSISAGTANSQIGTAVINDNGTIYATKTTFGSLTLNTFGNVDTIGTSSAIGSLTLNHIRQGETVQVGTNYAGVVLSVTDFQSLTFGDVRGTIDNNGGAITNATINEGGQLTGTGSIGNLHIGQDGRLDAAAYTGTIGNLTFSENGGLLLISGMLDTWGEVNFSTIGITGQVNLTGANIVLDLSAAQSSPAVMRAAASLSADDFSFNLAEIFSFTEGAGFADEENWWDSVGSVSLKLPETEAPIVLNALGSGTFSTREAGSSTPEPATLLILGLGLAGLRLVRRSKI